MGVLVFRLTLSCFMGSRSQYDCMEYLLSTLAKFSVEPFLKYIAEALYHSKLSRR